MNEKTKTPAPAPAQAQGMLLATARLIEYSIILLCIVSLAMIFQPFSLTLYSIGAGLVVLGGLAFNLVPLCVPGKPLAGVVKAAVTVLVILVIAICLAMGSAYLYGIYLQNV